MYCYTILVGLSCAILLHLVNGNFHPSTQEELSTDISPLLARFSELEATNVETQKQLLQLQKEILILRRENDLKSSELVKINQHLQLMTQSYPGHRFLTEDICHYVNEKCTTKIREDRQTAHAIAFSAYIDHLGGNNHNGNTLLYNKVLGNYGTGYDTNTGIFTAPETGIYGFLWVTQVHHGSWCSTRILRNGFILSMTSSYAKATSTSLTESGSGTGFLITYLVRGTQYLSR
uniref:Uncharacterized protein LOC111128735 n=1 Tax=Crassostrea virginica TaxID=6565 RepID=A0A8B8DTE5_CRAVI|nr:uncharacterized protein LOC111128735 [Crassostrea virginica]